VTLQLLTDSEVRSVTRQAAALLLLLLLTQGRDLRPDRLLLCSSNTRHADALLLLILTQGGRSDTT
jgi:hypothetical protein